LNRNKNRSVIRVHKKTKFVIKVETNKKGKKSNKGGKQDLHKSGIKQNRS